MQRFHAFYIGPDSNGLNGFPIAVPGNLPHVSHFSRIRHRPAAAEHQFAVRPHEPLYAVPVLASHAFRLQAAVFLGDVGHPGIKRYSRQGNPGVTLILESCSLPKVHLQLFPAHPVQDGVVQRLHAGSYGKLL